MKKTFAYPDFQMSMTIEPSQKTGKQLRKTLMIDGKEMVIPNSYEPEKWQTNTGNDAAAQLAKVLAEQAKLE